MNQDSFRKLLTTPVPRVSPRSSRVVGQSTKKYTLDVSEPAFQPRNVKKRKTITEYRDRASERRAGVNDYAQVESVLEDFEKNTATIQDRDMVEEQRRYLGGDEDHTILVRGLDFALLEQNKARVTLSHEDDESLEAAFREAQPKPLVPKRTREDIIREFKEKRASTSRTDAVTQEPMDKAFEDAKRVGKFKPIGAPDNISGHELSKKSKGKEKGHDKASGGDRKKKRRKVENTIAATADKHKEASMPNSSSEGYTASTLPSHGISADTPNEHYDPKALVLGPDSFEDPKDEVDIFVNVGEYEGLDFGENEDEEQAPGNVDPEEPVVLDLQSEKIVTVKSWFIEDEPASAPNPSPTVPPSTLLIKEPVLLEPEDTEPKQVTRLAPLASSVLPSISDFLAVDAEADAQKKRKAKKEKRKGGGKTEKGRTDVKLDRDFKKLNSYLAKKGDGSNGV